MINVFFQLQELRNTITGAVYYLLRSNRNRKRFFCLKQLFLANTYLIHRLSVEITTNNLPFYPYLFLIKCFRIQLNATLIIIKLQGYVKARNDPLAKLTSIQR